MDQCLHLWSRAADIPFSLRTTVSHLPADNEHGRDRPEPNIRLLPAAFTATAGGEPASPEAAYRAILETAIDAIMTIDARGRIVAHNAAACRMFGYGSDDLLGAHMADLVPAADRAALMSTITAYVSHAVRGARANGLELDAMHADGRTFPVHLAIGGMGRGARRLFTIIARDRSAEHAAAASRAATEREREAFRRVAEAAATGVEPAELFRLVAGEVADLLGAPVCVIARFDGPRVGHVVGSYNALGVPDLDVGDGLDLMRYPAMTQARDSQDVVRMHPSGDVAANLVYFGERAAAPLRVAGSVWGAFVAAVGPGMSLGDDADRQLRRFAQVIEVAVAESTAREALATRAAQQTVVAELGLRATEGAEVQELFQLACDGVRETMPADITAVMETQGEGEDIAVHAASGTPEPLPDGHRIARADAPITAAAIEQREPTLIEDTATLDGPAPIVNDHGIRTVLAAPIRLPDAVYGVIVGTRLSDRPFTPDDRAFLQSIANVLGAAIARVSDEAAMRRAALHDPLTGLPNRTLLLDRLASALARCAENEPRVAVLTCDFDGFARINEQAGHAAGDQVLRAAAARIAELLEPRDTLTRASGDEFVVIREDADGPADAGALGKRILDALSASYEVDGRVLPAVSASVGLVLRGRGDDPEAALRDADTAAHRAHARGRGHLEIFDESMREGLLARLALESDLRRMVHGRELRLHYMPLVSLEDGSIDGFEALVRWQHPVRGLLAPGEFIDAAEHTGAIREIGRWVIEQACRDAAIFQRAVDDRELRMSANLSPRQLADPGLVDHVAAALADAGVPADRLALEITETVLLEEDPVHLERLAALRSLGVKIVLDDFGTGYSSLSYLHELRLDGLKLDRSFVAGLGADERATTIVAAVTQLSRALGLPVTAEGVETPAQVVSLQTLGCEYGQGFLFSRPVPRAEARALLVR
jgi:diguanylate cyclase (GGDEF)-like protein/PAS domain S-box-containing protein